MVPKPLSMAASLMLVGAMLSACAGGGAHMSPVPLVQAAPQKALVATTVKFAISRSSNATRSRSVAGRAFKAAIAPAAVASVMFHYVGHIAGTVPKNSAGWPNSAPSAAVGGAVFANLVTTAGGNCTVAAAAVTCTISNLDLPVGTLDLYLTGYDSPGGQGNAVSGSVTVVTVAAAGTISPTTLMPLTTLAAPTGPFTAVSLSPTSPTALTALSVATTGLNTALPVTATFSDATGWTVTSAAINVSANGTVTVGVPLYFSAANNGKTASATVSLVLTQGTLSTKPLAVSIQDIPAFAVYGTAPGTITKAFYTYRELSIGMEIGDLQAVSAAGKLPMNVGPLQQQLKSLLTTTIGGQKDVVTVASGGSVSLGQLADGTAVNYDTASLELQDRIIAFYLYQMRGAFLTASTSTASSTASRKRTTMSRRAAQDLSPTKAVLAIIPILSIPSNIRAIKEGFATFISSDATNLQSAEGLMAAIKGGIGLTAASIVLFYGSEGAAAAAVAKLGVAGACAGVLKGLLQVGTDLEESDAVGDIVEDIRSGAPADQLTMDVAALPFVDTLIHSSEAVMSYLGTSGVSAGKTSDVMSELVETMEEPSNSSESTDAEVLNIESQQPTVDTDTQSIDQVVTFIEQNQQNGESFGEISGSVSATSGASPDPVVVEIVSGTTVITSTLVDPSGGYDTLVPIGLPGVDYSTLQVIEVDATSGQPIATGTTDLTGLSPQYGSVITIDPTLGPSSPSPSPSPSPSAPTPIPSVTPTPSVTLVVSPMSIHMAPPPSVPSFDLTPAFAITLNTTQQINSPPFGFLNEGFGPPGPAQSDCSGYITGESFSPANGVTTTLVETYYWNNTDILPPGTTLNCYLGFSVASFYYPAGSSNVVNVNHPVEVDVNLSYP